MVQVLSSFSRCALLTFCAVIVLLSGCAEQETEEVGNEYLRSEKYSAFKDSTSQEIDKNSKNQTFNSQLQQLSGCSEFSSFNAPFEIDVERVDELADNISRQCMFESAQNSLKLLAKTEFGKFNLGWVLFERQRAYREDELLVTIFQNEELQNFQTVGVFKKNPSEEIFSVIKGRSEEGSFRIEVQTNRNILYPIDQQNIVRAAYQINKAGEIREL